MGQPARRHRRTGGQNLTEYAIVLGVIAIICMAAISFTRESFRTLYLAHNEPLNAPVAALAMTATPDGSIPTATPRPPTPTGVLPTSTPIPTLTPTLTLLATATPVLTGTATNPTATGVVPTPTPEPTGSTLPDCDDIFWLLRSWYRNNGWCE